MKRRDFLAAGGAAPFISPIASAKPHALANLVATGNPGPARLLGRPAPIDASGLGDRNQNRSTMVCQNGVVATSQPLACSVGLDVLKAGGNAVDAAIAMNAMMGLVEPMSCGPGGDLFAIVWMQRDQQLYGLNASGRSPYEWNLDKAKSHGYEDSLPTLGPHTWSVPGCVSGWQALHSRLGRLPIDQILAPTAEYGRRGFPITEIISRGFDDVLDDFADFPNAMATYAPDGKAPQYGQVFRNPDMAHFIDILIRDGLDSFYQGEIAERIVNYSKERGGYFTMRDFLEHEAAWVDPVSSRYRGYDVWELPPNGQGIAALQMLNLLEHFDIASLEPNSPEHLHLVIEAKKLAFEDRAVYYADMDKAEVPVEWLISKDYAAERVKRIDPNRAAMNVFPGELDGSSDTIYLCAADAEGNMVSLIQSIYWGWGSREMPSGLGFCLQNRGRAFNLDPNHRNALEPNKRPFHTIIPGFVTQNGQPQCAFGVMGGDFQPQGHAQVLLNMIDYQLTPQQAGEQPRVYHYGSTDPWGSGPLENGGSIGLEHGIGDVAAERLAQMGHQISRRGGRYGGYQAIWRMDDPMRYFAGSEPRKDGCAMGY